MGKKTYRVSFDFFWKLKAKAKVKFQGIFQYLGAEKVQKSDSWNFPIEISVQAIQQVIKNTCYECGGLMKDSTALLNDWVSFDDFDNDAGQRGTTQSRLGPAKQITVRKCLLCGYSHT